MPPKTKKKEFIQCHFCGCFLALAKDLDKHLTICSGLEPFCWEIEREINFKDVHAVVDANERLLLAPVQVQKGNRNELNQVFLHPSTMQKAGFVYDETALLISDVNSILVKIMPSETTSIGHVKIEQPLPQPSVVILAACRNYMLKSINNAYLHTGNIKSFLKAPEFVRFLEQKLNGRKVHQNDIIRTRYYGQEVCMTIAKVDVDSETEIKFDTTQNLTAKIESLDMSNDISNQNGSDDSIYSTSFKGNSLTHSTPIKRNTSTCSAKSDISKPVTIPAVQYSNLQKDVLWFTGGSKIYVNEAEDCTHAQRGTTIDWTKLGGLEDVKKSLNCLIYVPAQKNDMSNIGIRTILLHGPSGCGKSLIGQIIASCNNPKSTVISANTIFTKTFSQAQSEFSNLFNESIEPRIVFLDDFDMLGRSGDEQDGTSSISESSNKTISLLSNILDNLPSNLWFIGCMRNPDRLDPALRRRFQIELLVGVPSLAGRTEILDCLVGKYRIDIDKGHLKTMANIAHGYTGSDLLAALRLAVADAALTECSLQEGHILSCIKKIRPSAMREVILEIPNARWDEIGGLDEVKTKIKQAVQWPIKHPHAFARLGVRPPSGILLYGPPGCSKTLLARTAAAQSGLNLLAVKGPEVFSKYVGESERSIRQLFLRARQVAPSLIFIDEIDAIAVSRSADKSSGVGDRVLAQLLTEMDGLEPLASVVLIAATNRPDIIDKALIRPGRLDRSVYVPLPDHVTRREIIKLRLQKMPLADFSDSNLEDLTSRTEGYSGAEVVAVCDEAALSAMRQNIDTESVRWSDFSNALKIVLPLTDHKSIELYSKFATVNQ